MDVTVLDQLALGLLEGTTLDPEPLREFTEGLMGGTLGEALDVQEQNLRVAAQTRMTYDVVRRLRVAPGRRDNMPKHFRWVHFHW